MADRFIGLPQYFPDEKEFRRRVSQVVNRTLVGKTNNVSDEITLVASTATTVATVSPNLLGEDSAIIFVPTSANAAAEVGAGGMFVSSRSVADNTFNITHANNAQTDRTFKYVIIG